MSVYRIQYGGIVGKPINYSEFLCDNIEDINMLPTNSINTNTYNTCSIGSIAYVNGIKYILNNNGIWEINYNTKQALFKEHTDDKTLSILESLDGYLNKTTTSINDYEEEYVPGYLYATCPIETINNSNIKVIDAGAFERCKSLTNVNLPNLIILENGAFNGCSLLSSFNAPNIELIGCNALSNSQITELDLAKLKTIKAYGLYGLSELHTINAPNIEIIGDYGFYGNKLTGIDISNVKSIGKNAFYACQKLQSVILGNIKIIPEMSFGSCKALSSVYLPDSVKVIEDYAFESCTSLTSININKVEIIKSGVFSSCKITSLSSEYVKSITSLFGNTANSSLKNISFPNLEHLGTDAFSLAQGLTSIDLPNAIDTHLDIKDSNLNFGMFYNCSKLTTVNLPKLNPRDNHTKNMFNLCTKLTNVNIPKVKKLYEYAFRFCRELPEIHLPSVVSINIFAFTGCTALLDIYLPNAENAYTGAPWGATNATIHYECEFNEDGIPLELIEENNG